ncbi:hypothetical protein [Streptomyces sp. DH41]|uniref:hypothetical protein n=1 Tax=Streptomyces sp. DH41 TaxID=3040125 RepID=UPI002441CB4B|nr:hypothetical protein [Streptomyces sp. DH41]MDG9721438.1 hypothetical protein [Streptomyces sp. DH41]
MAAEQHPGGHDALMAAIMGEPLPPGAGADTGAEAEYRSAAADVELLREQLGIIGRSLGEPPAERRAPAAAEPVHRPGPRRPRRRPLALAFGALAAACAAALVTGLGWLVVRSGSGAAEDTASGSAAVGDKEADSAEAGGAAFGSPRYLACARLVAEGTVTGAEPVPGTGRHRITLDVTRSFKPEERPERGGEPVTFVLDDTTARLAVGDHALIGVPRYGNTPDTVITGEEAVATERAWITASLPEARTLTCD